MNHVVDNVKDRVVFVARDRCAHVGGQLVARTRRLPEMPGIEGAGPGSSVQTPLASPELEPLIALVTDGEGDRSRRSPEAEAATRRSPEAEAGPRRSP